MSPAPKTKSKDKTAPAASFTTARSASSKTSKDKPLYNPVSGTFHILDPAPSPADPTSLLLNPGKFHTIDETLEDHSPNSQYDFDSASNHDSCSGESEDTTTPKDKPTTATTTTAATTTATKNPNPNPAGCETDNKREKIRQKNEKKHQRQKERRAQELHEKCGGYLMSRKLELLSQQLVAMGFSQEQATMALIQNEGRVEESVAWLFEGGEENSRQPEGSAADLQSGVGLKIDIADELAKISDLELKFRCSKQEVERAVVACEGDLVKAEESLKSQKQQEAATRPATPPLPKLEPQVKGGGVSVQNSVVGTSSQQNKGERDFNYTKVSQEAATLASKNLPPVSILVVKQQHQQLPQVEKRWAVSAASASASSFPSSTASHLPVSVPQVKPDSHYTTTTANLLVNKPESQYTGNLVKGGLGLREQQSVIVMQRGGPQSVSPIPKQSVTSNTTITAANGGAVVPGLDMRMYSNINRGLGLSTSSGGSTTGAAPHFVPQSHSQHVVVPNSVDLPVATWGNSNGSSLSVPSSLGLFTSWGSGRNSSPRQTSDWGKNGDFACDYTAIDWSLDLALLKPSSANSSSNSRSNSNERLSNTWSTMFMGGLNGSGSGNANANAMVRRVVGNSVNLNMNGNSVAYQDNGGGYATEDVPGGSRFHEWTSPFSGEDILGTSRKYVMSPVIRGGDGFLE